MAIAGTTQVVGGQEVTVLVEVDELPKGASAESWGETRVNAVEKVIDATRDVFGEGLALARDCGTRAVDSLKWADAALRPQEIELQIAIKLGVEAGAIVAKAGAEAQMQVTMRWAPGGGGT